jgi:hypothetical protein
MERKHRADGLEGKTIRRKHQDTPLCSPEAGDMAIKRWNSLHNTLNLCHQQGNRRWENSAMMGNITAETILRMLPQTYFHIINPESDNIIRLRNKIIDS